MSVTCHLICAGPDGGDDYAIGKGDFVVACDGGYAKCATRGIEPGLVLGDFDSLEGGRPAECPCECVELPWEKDDTDLQAALRVCLKRGFDSFVIHDALGGDLGHTAAAIRSVAWLRKQGATAVVEGCGQRATIVLPGDGCVHFDAAPGARVSVFSFGGEATGVCEGGMHWSVEGIEIAPEASFGVSNQVESSDPWVSVDRGMLLLIYDL